MVVSIERPWSMAQSDAPLPRWQLTIFNSRGRRFKYCAAASATWPCDEPSAASLHVFVQHVGIVVAVGEDAGAGAQQRSAAGQHLTGDVHLVSIEREHRKDRDLLILADDRVQLVAVGFSTRRMPPAGIAVLTDRADAQRSAVDAEGCELCVLNESLMHPLQQGLKTLAGHASIQLRD